MQKNDFSEKFSKAIMLTGVNNESKEALCTHTNAFNEDNGSPRKDTEQGPNRLLNSGIKRPPTFKFYLNMKKAVNMKMIKDDNQKLPDHQCNSSRFNVRPVVKTMKETSKEKIFWSKIEINNFQKKIREAYNKIYLKKKKDYETIDLLIAENNEKRLFEFLNSQQFKKFYKKDLCKTQLLEMLFKAGFPSLTRSLLEADPTIFRFDNMLIVRMLKDQLQPNQIESSEFTEKPQEYLASIIEYNLYSPAIVYLLAYLASTFGYCKEFSMLLKKEADCFEDDMELFENFDNDQSILNFSNSKLCFNAVIGSCLSNSWEDISIAIYKNKGLPIEQDIIGLAIDLQRIEFLEHIWESQTNLLEKDISRLEVCSSTEKISQAEVIDRKISLICFDTYILFKVSKIIDSKKSQMKKSNIAKMLKWKHLEYDRPLIEILMKHNLYEEVLIIINDNRHCFWTFKPEYFTELLNNNDYLLIPFFLQSVDLKKIINKSETQKQIVQKYIRYGHKIYYGAEMLSQVYKYSWNQDNTILLCKYIQKSLKLKDILNCHSPILTCTLLCEFLEAVSSVSIHYSPKIHTIINELIDFCEILQNTTNEENYIRFLMEQKSIFGRTALNIIADNNYYKCLKNHNVGTIVGKMWNGQIPYNSLFAASSLQRYLKKSINKDNSPFSSFDPIDPSKNYLFQLSVWENSCSLRHFPEAILTLSLIINFSIFTYQISGYFRDKLEGYDIHKMQIYKANYFLYFIQIACININTIYRMVFSFFTDRKAMLTVINYLEFILLLLSSFIFINFGNIGVVNSAGEDTIISILLSLITVGVWIRILAILYTSKGLGPLIRMIYLMSLLLIKYIFIYIVFIICMSAVFTSIFFYSCSNGFYNDFITSLINLITPFVSNFSTSTFEQSKLLGSVMIMIYTALTAILLMNLLIAVLSSVYDELYSQVDSAHRCALIQFHKNLEWSKEYGYMIFLPNPLNIFNLLVLPFQILNGVSNRESQLKFNRFICKLYFGILYTPFIIVIFVIYTSFLVPICYFKCIALLFKSLFSSSKNSLVVPQLAKAIVLGVFYLIYFNLRDVYYILLHQYNEIRPALTEIDRIKNFITPEDIIIFLDFIHSLSTDKAQSLAEVFENYLIYENSVTLGKSEELKEKSDYLMKLNKLSDNRNVSILSFIKDTKKKQSVVKKNLIIIEVLENFVDQSLEELFVDIHKMKLLLPRGFEINDDYIKRLIYTNIQLINLAVMKLKSNKNSFLQYQLINKIMQRCVKVDKEIDYEIHKNLILHKSADHSKKCFDDSSEINLLLGMSSFFEFCSSYFQEKCKEKERKYTRIEQQRQLRLKLRLRHMSSKGVNNRTTIELVRGSSMII